MSEIVEIRDEELVGPDALLDRVLDGAVRNAGASLPGALVDVGSWYGRWRQWGQNPYDAKHSAIGVIEAWDRGDRPNRPEFIKEIPDEVLIRLGEAVEKVSDGDRGGQVDAGAKFGAKIQSGMSTRRALFEMGAWLDDVYHQGNPFEDLGIGGGGQAGGSVARPLIGRLRIIGRSFGDDTGPRRVLFCSWFPALWVRRNQTDRYYRQLDAIVSAGFQGVRVFRAVGGDPNGNGGREQYWRNRQVTPKWPDYDEQLRGLLGDFRDRGLRVHLTAGDMAEAFPGGRGEQEFTERVARLVQDGGFADTVGLFEVYNEGWQNNAHGDNPGHAARMAEAFRRICPSPLIALSAPSTNEEPDGLHKWGRSPADVNSIHGERGRGGAIRRAFNLRYEGDFKPLWQGEPTGPGAGVSVAQNDDPAFLFGLFAMHHLTGQASVYFNGPAIKYEDGRSLEDTWGFRELPGLLEQALPEDVGQWGSCLHGNRGDAPISSHRFSDVHGDGPARVDMVFSGAQIACLVYDGKGRWPIYARRSIRARVYDHTGQVGDFEVRGGRDIPGDWHAGQYARLIVGEFI